MGISKIMEDYDETFESSDAGASLTYPKPCGDIKKGGHMIINGRPCKVTDYSTCKTGKHGHAKASIVAIDVFTHRKLEDSLPASHTVEVPNIKRQELTLVTVDDDGFVSLMNGQGEVTSDLKLPEDTDDDKALGKKIRDYCETGEECIVTVLSAMGIDKLLNAEKLRFCLRQMYVVQLCSTNS